MKNLLVRSTLLATALALLGGSVGIATSARADAGAADALFKAGKDLLAQGKVAEACSKFEASYNEDSALGALMNLANCREQQGLIAAAWARWGEAVEKAKRLNDERFTYCQERRDKLGPRLPHLTVQVENLVPGLVVYRGSQVLDPGAFGTALPIEPGETTLQVTQGDDVFWQQTIQLSEGQQATVKIDLKKIYDSGPSAKKKRSKTDVKGGGVAGAGPQLPFWNGQRIAGLTVGLGGVTALGVGLTFGGVALSQKADVDSNCTPADKSGKRLCTQAGLDSQRTAKTNANVGQWVGIAGAVVAGVGVTLFATAPSGTAAVLEKRADLRPHLRYATPWASPDGGGFVTGGTF